MANENKNQIFQGVEGFSGFYQAFSGGQVTIAFQRVETDSQGSSTSTEKTIDQGFLVQQYTAQWQRQVSIERVLNRDKPVAMIGAGVGTLQIQGLMGTAEGMKSLLQSNEFCKPLTAVIKGAATLTQCDAKGKASTDNKQMTITLTNVIPNSITIQGSAQNQGIMLQSANASFQFGGFKLDVGGGDDGDGDEG